MSNYFDGLSETEAMTEIEKLRDEIIEMKADQRRYLDRRKRRGHQTSIDSLKEGQQKTLQKAIDLLDKMCAEYRP
jgi:hypothetical protein